MKKIKKLLSFAIALAMVVTIALPGLKAFAEGETDASQKTSVTIHKMEVKDVSGWPSKTGKNNEQGKDEKEEYIGAQIRDTANFFGNGGKEIAGVKFHVYKVADKETYEKLTTTDYATKEKVDAANKAGGALEGKFTEFKTVTTTANGVKIVDLDDGYYWIVEDRGSKIEGGKTLGKMAAVPVGLVLPIYKQDGTGRVADVHVYPKNTVVDEPTTDKKQKKGDEYTKDQLNKNIGDKVEYSVETVIKAGAEYKTVYWSDQMTEGLTFNDGSVKVYKGEIRESNIVPNTSYTYIKDGNGFKLSFNDTYIKDNVNGQTEDVKFILTYDATINEKAVVDRPDANRVQFHYGNNPSKGNTPVPNKPNENGEMEATKKMADGTTWGNQTFELTLYDAHTNEVVGQPKTVSATNQTARWGGLDKNKQYIVKEKLIAGFEPVYSIGEAGQIIITNHPNDNPPPITPDPVKVITGGKKFQKTGEDKKGLKGAKFVVKAVDGDYAGKYLKKKSKGQQAVDQADYDAKEAAYQKAVAAKPADNEAINAAKVARDAAYKKAQSQWTWVDENSKDSAATFTSGENGYFMVNGLAYGKYQLIEIEAPDNYAKLKDPRDFEVKAGSTDEKVQEVENKKVTIPETGGIGTIIFIVIGIALMGGAIFGLRRREEA